MEHIILVAQQISNEGKTPTTALVKSRLPKNTPLAEIMQGVKLWKANPQQIIEIPNEETQPASLAPLENGSVDALINQLIDNKLNEKIADIISPLKIQITALQKEIEQLKNKIEM